MEKPSENININTSNEVRQNSFDEHIELILNSVDIFKEDFYDTFDSLPKTKQKPFVKEMYEWISTAKFARYYDRKYIRSRKKENPIFNFDQLDFIRAEQEDFLFLKGVRDYEGLKYPATEIWIKRKKEEIKNFYEELELLYSSIQEKESIYGSKKEVDYRDKNEYQFPDNLIDSTFDKVTIDNSFRMPTRLSLEIFKKHFSKSLVPIEAIMDEECYLAFLHNSFNFRGNNTTPTPLKLKTSTTKGYFKQLIFKLYEECRSNTRVEKDQFGKIMFINFPSDRVRSFEPNYDFKTHLKNLIKSIR